PDDLLQQFHRVFEKDERGVFPADLLDRLAFSVCDRCNAEHARTSCPLCGPTIGAPKTAAMVIRGEVACKHVFETNGAVVHVCVERGELRFVHHDGAAYRREDGSLILRGGRNPALSFRISKASTLVGRGRQILVIAPDAPTVTLGCDSDGTGPAF